MKALLTGAAGLFGCRVVKRLPERRAEVVGFEAQMTQYEPDIRQTRVTAWTRAFNHGANVALQCIQANLADQVSRLSAHGLERVINLAVQTEVHHSLGNPYPFCRNRCHRLSAECRAVDQVVQFDAASKSPNELMGHSYKSQISRGFAV
ncbi:NAD-dependent epimerase/dehydratase family protein [Mesorhizobium sp. M0833]|uniref:NAD-dependent epimerase/dehydratase family protein n=1 Tax=Mesorhizobium sp. M0833 TaxID=2957009 RepID=UPI0033353B51